MLEKFREVRSNSEAMANALSDADATVQSMEDTSPVKWHLAHITWFFETFILRDYVEGYQPFDQNFAYLFNSYYNAEGQRHARARRGMLTRPSLEEVIAYRQYVDTAMVDIFEQLPDSAMELVELGIHHEQQHQELLLTDILHLFAQNPLLPAYVPGNHRTNGRASSLLKWIEGPSGIQSIGHNGVGFGFDCEGPRHEVILRPYALANRTITNGEWINFMNAGGYSDPTHWLADGWTWVQRENIHAPLYWQQDENDAWHNFGLAGLHSVDLSAPVTHICLYEADAYASWSGNRLPTEAEWEIMATPIDPEGGHQFDGSDTDLCPQISSGDGLSDMFGNVWEWTGSAYRPYPGFRAAQGAVGEYNGKFMSGQFVLRGGSCATPRGHIRASYRNFFYPHQRWQFSGLRLARDI